MERALIENETNSKLKGDTKFMHESYSLNKNAGYINKMIMGSSGKEIIMACEKGIYI